jgi:hypothetical protein
VFGRGTHRHEDHGMRVLVRGLYYWSAEVRGGIAYGGAELRNGVLTSALKREMGPANHCHCPLGVCRSGISLVRSKVAFTGMLKITDFVNMCKI